MPDTVAQSAQGTPARLALSIVVPVYRGAESIGELVTALEQLRIAGGHEIVLVNDGSPDDSLAVCRDLERTEDGHVDVSATDHRERPGRIDDRCAGAQRDLPASRVHQIAIRIIRGGQRADTDDAVLRLKEHVEALGDVIGNGKRQAETEIDERAVGDVLGGTPCHLTAIELHGVASGATTTRST